tara:strand:+ start:44 stop:583 length:540 start_codon:yes stop_codon:yes gene_type:complete
MNQSRSIYKYAKALYDLARKAESVEDTLKRLNILNTINSSSPEFRYFLRSKRIETNAKSEIVAKILADTVSELEIGLLVHLIDNGETGMLSAIVKQFTMICDSSDSTMKVTVTTASNLDKEEEMNLLKSVEKKLNKKVNLDCVTDQSVIGGAKFRVGNMIVDGTISTRLKKLEKSLYEG